VNAQERQLEKWAVCDTRYVAWKWMVGIIVTFIVAIGSLSYAGGRWGAEVEAKVNGIDKKVVNVQTMQADMDTIKVLLRGK